MGIFIARSPNKIGNSSTYVEVDTANNFINVYVNGVLKNRWKP